MTLVCNLALCMMVALVAGCTRPAERVIVEKPVEVRVPVAVPCVGEKPSEPAALRDRVSRDQWSALTTDQREKLLASQGLDRKAYGDRLNVATAGCN